MNLDELDLNRMKDPDDRSRLRTELSVWIAQQESDVARAKGILAAIDAFDGRRPTGLR